MRPLTTIMIFVSLLLSAAIFGFFYAWVCSTMWGLDAADPRVSIQAMQAMNASVRNVVFAPAFFGTPFALASTALLLLVERRRRSAIAFALGSAVYFCFGFAITATVNVPMNEALAAVSVPTDVTTAGTVWREYSERWQFWNQVRTIASGAAFLFTVTGVLLLGRSQNRHPPAARGYDLNTVL